MAKNDNNQQDDNQTNTLVREEKTVYSEPSDSREQGNNEVILNAPGSDFSELKKSEAARKDDMPLDNTPAGKAAHNDDGRDMTQDEPDIKDQVDLNNQNV